tara:strand:+ start:60 stop:332 length:273 start_codon:yes stop_codon:yes gene_type:complete
MKKILIFIFLIITIISSNGFASSIDCKKFKKFSVEYFKCKGNIVKDKTISAGQNIIKDTKDYQNNEWSDGKEKIDNAKDKINKAKKKVLD